MYIYIYIYIYHIYATLNVRAHYIMLHRMISSLLLLSLLLLSSLYDYVMFSCFCVVCFDSASLPFKFLNRLPGGCSGGEGTPPETLGMI